MSLNIRGAAPGTKDIALDKAELVAVFLEALLYGIEALTFVATVYLLHGAKRTKTLFLKLTSVVIIFLLNTIHIGSSLRRVLNAFVGTTDDPIPDASAYLGDLAGFLYRFKNIIIIIQFIMLDILVIYRCFMIWDRKIVVTIVPSVGIIGFLVTGIAAIHAFATFHSGSVFTGVTKTWVSAMLCVTLFIKLVCFATVLAGTLFSRPTSPWQSVYLRVNRHETLYKHLLIGIESGGLAVLGAIILIPVYLSGRNAQGILLGAMSPLTGQSFLLIIAAALLGLTPSTSGPSRRRNGRIPDTRFSVAPISVTSVGTSPSRFSTHSLFKSKSQSKSPTSPTSHSPRTPADMDYTHAHGFGALAHSHKNTEPDVTYMDPRYGGGAEHGANSDDSSRETLGYGQRETISVTSSVDVAGGNTFHLARSADGAVEVLQRERVVC